MIDGTKDNNTYAAISSQAVVLYIFNQTYVCINWALAVEELRVYLLHSYMDKEAD